MLLMLKSLRMLLMPLLLHRPKLRALLLVVLVTVHLLVVAAVIAHLLVVVIVLLLVAVLLLHLLMAVMEEVGILLGLVQRMARPVPLIGKATIISLSKNSDIL